MQVCALVAPQRPRRRHSTRAHGRNDTRDQHDGHQHHCHPNVVDRIGRPDSVEQPARSSTHTQGDDEAYDYACGSRAKALPQRQADDLAPACTKGHADADLARALRRDIGDHAVDATAARMMARPEKSDSNSR